MRVFLISIFGLITLIEGCNGQTQANRKEIFTKDFNWTITIPENFEKVSADDWTKMQNKEIEVLEKANEEKIENNSKIIFVFKSDKFNYFEALYQPFDEKKDGKYSESFKSLNTMLYTTFQSQMPIVKMDSASSQELIAGLSFRTFKITIDYPNKMTMNFWVYCRLFGNKEFTSI